MAGFALNLAALGLSAHAGVMTISTGNADQWRQEQNRLGLLFKSAFDRILAFDNLALRPEVVGWSAQRNLRVFLKEQISANDSYSAVALKV